MAVSARSNPNRLESLIRQYGRKLVCALALVYVGAKAALWLHLHPEVSDHLGRQISPLVQALLVFIGVAMSVAFVYKKSHLGGLFFGMFAAVALTLYVVFGGLSFGAALPAVGYGAVLVVLLFGALAPRIVPDSVSAEWQKRAAQRRMNQAQTVQQQTSRPAAPAPQQGVVPLHATSRAASQAHKAQAASN